MNIELNETYQNYIKEQLEAGRYANVSELLAEAYVLRCSKILMDKKKSKP
jgi:Arc/MetJ-type ribon-helix-helix transcriptional regulator